jgi:hypothetical protein
MYTSLIVVVLAGFSTSAAVSGKAAWLDDYGTALKQVQKENKPVAVIISFGPSGWEKLSRQGELGKEIHEILANQYVCLYVDTSEEKGKRLAADFEITGGPGLVISDRTGKLQAFWHEGNLGNGDLVRFLQRYSDPQVVTRGTETNRNGWVSNYPRESFNPAPPASAPVYRGYTAIRGFGRSC